MTQDYAARRAAKKTARRKAGKDAKGNFFTVGVLKRTLQGKKRKKCRGMCYKGVVPTLEQARADDGGGRGGGAAGEGAAGAERKKRKRRDEGALNDVGPTKESLRCAEARLRTATLRGGWSISADVIAPFKFSQRSARIAERVAAAATASGNDGNEKESPFIVVIVGGADVSAAAAEMRGLVDPAAVRELRGAADVHSFVRSRKSTDRGGSAGAARSVRVVVMASSPPSAHDDGRVHAAALQELCSLWSCGGAVVHGITQFNRAEFRSSMDAMMPDKDEAGEADMNKDTEADLRRSVVFMLSSVIGRSNRKSSSGRGGAGGVRVKTCSLFLTRDDFAAADGMLAVMQAIGGEAGDGLVKLQEAAVQIRRVREAETGEEVAGGARQHGTRQHHRAGGGGAALLKRRHVHALPASACSLLRPQGKLLNGIMTLKKRMRYQPSMLRLIEYARDNAA